MIMQLAMFFSTEQMRWPVGHETVAAGPMIFGDPQVLREIRRLWDREIGPTSLDVQRFPTVPSDP